MKFGSFISIPSLSFESVLKQANLIEKSGFNTIFFPDHTVTIPSMPGMCFDALNMLSALAMYTKNKLCTAVSDCHRFHPALMAQKIATLDHISSGRAMFGIGAGEKMNVDMYGLNRAKSIPKLREYIELIRAFWTKKRVNKKSEFWGDIKKAFIQIKPLQKKIPIYIAANGPKSRKLAGELGDGWFPEVDTPWTYKMNKNEVLEAAKKIGRKPEDIDFCYFCRLAIDDDTPEKTIKSFEYWRTVRLIFSPDKINQIYPNLNIPTDVSIHNYDLRSNTAKVLEYEDKLPKSFLSDIDCIGTTDDVIANIEKFKEAGVTHMVFDNLGPDTDYVFEIFRDKVIPYFKEEDK